MKFIPCPVALSAQKFADLPAILSGTYKISYRELNAAIEHKTKTLRSKKISTGTRVAILGENSIDFVITLFALWRRSSTIVLLNKRLPPQVVKEQCNDLNCRHLLRPAKDKHQSPTINIASKEALRHYPADGIATIMFTSGTSSGHPKAAAHTFENHYFSAKGSQDIIPLNTKSRWLLTLPLYHVGGLSVLFRTFMFGGCVIIPTEEETLPEAIQHYRPTHVSLVTVQLHRLLQERRLIPILQKMETILLGGGPMPEPLIETLIRQRLRVRLTYGLTEMSSQVATTPILSRAKSSRRVRILPYRNVRIQNGEILVKGKTLFAGYVQKHRVQHTKKTADGWFLTGDLGKLHSDKTLEITGRKDNMFISGGENIQPEEIEIILQKIPGIQEAVVIPKPHPEFGMRPVAFLQKSKGSKISTKRIRTHLEQRLPKYKIPDEFYQLPDMITASPLKKINRTFLQENKGKNFKMSRLG